uniref:very-long-chain (3R)-3-hydroxyacyl-CoA dehydratase n=1 Tax=Neobodo designis TaxID=312471 RepID=A0A7S1L587_NEODS|mmetsp:Transcript_14671/g.45474  ORF Transcript_14671/g.45474 Transcript_14671/m.45474 type:complete len:745 (+) Transcript_14671:40-2274(+)|eukprot:CAMPEP_0174830222 /NCGR_PEP_ID=MMETSP1114-20130205/2402_1 /TAXON_ID=312471 /ORGANISM="Neobodo designis, Strain CCAP 1951/1" /LENGTH=744 /DNA_ID=CAMNT_0016064013 /DNA_START=40 /DNA_END=2274 /DNA_ORIENTATION=-
MVKPYLFVYNLASAALWAYVLFLSVTSFQEGASPATAWARFSLPLLVVQTAAGLEVVHSMVKLVKSPVFSTALQVASRYGVLWMYTFYFPEAQAHWSLYLMVTSWALVEVPRYLYYAVHLYLEVPFPLFWLRYSLFAILYPTGISGELLQIFTSLGPAKRECALCWYLSVFLILMYIPGSPFMFTHMVKQRRKMFKARSGEPTKKAAPPASGVEFPLDKKSNARSTTIVNQGTYVAAVKDVDPEASAAAAKEKNWRYGYAKHVVRNVEISCKSNATCLKVAKAGLDYLHANFEFVTKDGTMSVADAMTKIPGTFQTYTIEGTGKRAKDFEYTVPYQKFESKTVNNLKGKALLEQLDKWVAKGVIEADARDAVAAMVKQPELHSTALQDRYFVLLGAGSAMGPLRVLLELGANIIAVDINREPVWKRLIEMARNSPGKMIIPVSKDPKTIKDDAELAQCAGADLLNDTPKIANWVMDQQPGKQLVLGCYAYLDSALFVRLAIAMDAIVARVLEKRKNAALGFLCSPTDVFVTSDETHEARAKALKRVPWWQSLLKLVLPKKMLVKNAIRQVKSDDGKTFSIVDGLAVAQGPNYALAKRLQHWRCMLAREAGHTVSTNIAPSTATVSVVHNPQFAAAYKGMGYFAPMEIVYQDLSNAMMTAVLINDVCNPKSPANASFKLDNQIRLFAYGSCHFGIWRMAYKCGSIGEVSALIGYMKIYAIYLHATGIALSAFAALVANKGAPHTW